MESRPEAERADDHMRLELAMDAGELGPWEVDLASMTLKLDERTRRLFGVPGSEYPLSEWLLWVDPEQRERIWREFEEALAGRRNYEMEYRAVRDILRWVHVKGKVLRDASGRAVRAVGFAQDITRRKLAEEALRESEARYRRIVQAAYEGVWLFDLNFATTYVNNRMAHMLGYSPAEMLGRTPFDFITEDEVPRAKIGIARSRQERGAEFEEDVHFRHRDGSEVILQMHGGTISDDEGRPMAFLAMFTDVSAQRQAQAETERLLDEHRRQREFLEKLVENAPIAIGVAEGPELRYTLANRRLSAAAGGVPVSGRTADQVFPGHREHLEECRRAKQPIIIREREIAGPGGELTYWSTGHVPLLGPAGGAESVLVMAQEVTETVLARKRAEELAAEAQRRAAEAEEMNTRFRSLMEGGFIGIIVADEERVLEANRTFLDMLGYTGEDLAEGRLDWRTITAPEDVRRGFEAIREVAEKGACAPYEKHYLRKDGSRVPALVGASMLRQEPRIQWISFIFDLTERKRFEEQLRQAQKMESIGVLAGGIAHDFNNILTGIIGNASLVLDSLPAGDSNRGMMRSLISSAERAADLTRQMLAYAGKGRFVTRKVNLSSAAGEIMRLLRASIPASTAIELDLASDLPPVEADSGQIHQVIMNLVLNAAEAIGEQAGAIHIRTYIRVLEESGSEAAGLGVAPGPYVAFEVRDNGCGMDAATLERIFEPFFTTKFAGRGLGLAAVQGIVKSHRGAIRVESGPGAGSCFELLFPAAAPGTRTQSAAG